MIARKWPCLLLEKTPPSSFMDAGEAVELALATGATRLLPYHWDGYAGNTVAPGTVVDAAAARIEVIVPARFGAVTL